MKNVPCALQRLLIPAVALLLTMNTYAASEKTLFDFQTATNPAAWQVVNDDVMGGISTSRFSLADSVATFRGDLSLENNGGFASVRSVPANYELAGYDTLVIRVRGDGRQYKLTARTAQSFDSAIYQCAFTTKAGEWQEHRLPMAQFIPTLRGRILSGQPPLDPAKLTSVGFLISDRQSGPFRLDIAWIKASHSR